MNETEFYSYTLAEFDALVERANMIRRRTFDIPSAHICATLANYAGKQVKEGVTYTFDDFLLRTKEEAEAYEEQERRSAGLASLEAFAARFANIQSED